MFKKKKFNAGEVFQDLLREKSGNPNLWVPGIGNGAMSDVVAALNQLTDKELIELVRAAARGKK